MRAFGWRYPWAVPVVVAFAVHLSCLFGGFVYDDVPLIVEHPLLSSSDAARAVWTRDYGLEFAGEARGFYRPLFMTGVVMLHRVAGANALVFHFVSLMVFCLATVLVVRTAQACLCGSPYPAMIAGVFYALHPARVEVVSLVMSLPDLVVELCALGVVLCLLRNEAMPERAWRSSLLCMGLAGVAALTKESAFFVFPALALTAGGFGVLHGGWRSGQVRAAAGILLGLSVCLVLRWSVGVPFPGSTTASVIRLMGADAIPALKTLGLAVWGIVWPGPVIFWRQFGGPASVLASAALVGLVVGVGLLWLGLVCRRRSLWPALLVAWLGANLVNLMLLTAGDYPYSQRYLALAPALILLVLGSWRVASRLVDGGWRRALGYGVVALLATHGAYALAGTFVCWTPLGFFRAMHESNPCEVVPLGAVAQTLNKSGFPAAEVEAAVQQATSLNPKHPQITLLHNMVIRRYLDEGAFGEALRFVNASLVLHPANPEKKAFKAVALASLGRYDEAIDCIDQALAHHPEDPTYQQLRRDIQRNKQKSVPPLK